MIDQKLNKQTKMRRFSLTLSLSISISILNWCMASDVYGQIKSQTMKIVTHLSRIWILSSHLISTLFACLPNADREYFYSLPTSFALHTLYKYGIKMTRIFFFFCVHSIHLNVISKFCDKLLNSMPIDFMNIIELSIEHFGLFCGILLKLNVWLIS